MLNFIAQNSENLKRMYSLFRTFCTVIFLFFSIYCHAQIYGVPQDLARSIFDTQSLTMGDLSGDETADFVMADNNYVYLILNKDGMSVSPRIRLEGSYDQINVMDIFDYDEDGDEDILLVTNTPDNKLNVLENDGNGSFSAPMELDSVNSVSNTIRLEDLDSDGDRDIIVASNNFIGWLQNNGNGQYNEYTLLTDYIGNRNSMQIDDLDGDGDLDIVYDSNSLDRLYWIENLGSALNWQEHIIREDIECTVTTADYDGDGDSDIIYSDSNENECFWIENLGSGSFGSTSTLIEELGGFSGDFIFSDIDMDGNLDCIARMNSLTRYFKSTGTGFQMINLGMSGIPSTGPIELADLNGDAQDEIIFCANGTPSLYNLEGSTYDVFNAPILMEPENYVKLAANDFDSDGHVDLIIASEEYTEPPAFFFFEGDGNGYFKREESPTGEDGILLMDYDGDDDQDMVIHDNNEGNIQFRKNQSPLDFSFDFANTIQNLDEIVLLINSDIDGDGLEDLFMAHGGNGAENYLAWFKNIGGSFGNEQIISTLDFVPSYSSEIGDFDGDGDHDLLTWHSSADSLVLLLNNGNGVFDNSLFVAEILAASNQFYLSSCDIDGDSDLDFLAFDSNTDALYWYENEAGMFTPHQIVNNITSGPIIGAEDLNADGLCDVVFYNSSDNSLGYFINLGSGLFSDFAEFYQTEAPIFEALFTDLDSDGGIDLIISEGISSNVSLFMNEQPIGCTDPVACNYDSEASIDGGNCCYECGCTLEWAANYDPAACFDDGSCLFDVQGTVFFDLNGNGFQNNNDYGLPAQTILVMPDSVFLVTNDEGLFQITLPHAPEYTFGILPDPDFPIYTNGSLTSINTMEPFWNEQINFGLDNNSVSNIIHSDLYIPNNFGCEEEMIVHFSIDNPSNAILDVTAEVSIDSLFTIIDVNGIVDSISGQTFYYSISSLLPGQNIVLSFELLSPSVDNIGDSIAMSYQTEAFSGTILVDESAGTVYREITCAYDPNDKQVFPYGYSDAHYVANDTTLEYLVRFQNTGNAPAQNIWIRDTLDVNLDISTLQILGASHSVFTTIEPDNRSIEFFFEDIMLPDSVNNEPESHGSVIFSIRPEANLPLLTELNNTAHIFFDNNPPIVTNTTWSTIYDCSLFEVSFSDSATFLTASEGDYYQWFFNGDSIPGANSQTYNATIDGNYSVQVGIDFPCSDESSMTYISVIGLEELDQDIMLFPNPMTQRAILEVKAKPGIASLEIFDTSGKRCHIAAVDLSSGILQLERGDLKAGQYILRIKNEDSHIEVSFIVE